MFTPPPSTPFPVLSSHNEYSSPPPIDCKLQHPKLMNTYPHSPTSPKSGPSRIINDAKKRTQRWILFTLALLPALLVALALCYRCFSGSHLLGAAYQTAISAPVKRSPTTNSTLISSPTGSSTSTSTSLASSVTSSTTTSSTLPTSEPSSLTFPTIPNPPVLTQQLPQPFDETLLANFSTVGCQNFFTAFLQNPDFRQCRAFSFLLNSSAGFLSAQRNITLFNEILGATCNTPPTFDTCDERMVDLLNQLTGNCTQDISLRNPIVLQAQISFQSYTAMRLASCLQDPAVNAYCYIEALSEASRFGDIYLFGIPLGTPVPAGVNLSCSSCSKDVLSVYSQFVNPTGATVINAGSDTSGNSTATSIAPSALPVLSMTYPNTAHLAIQECGGKFASVGITQNSAYHRVLIKNGLGSLAMSLGVVVSLWVF